MSIQMKDYVNLVLPTESADGYYMRANKSQINSFIYLEPEWYQKLLDPNTFYILGSKGSGKTLYAAYMCAEIRDNTVSRSHTIDVADYGKLIAMKTKNHLEFTEYLTMWKVVLLQKFLLGINASDISFLGRSKGFNEIQRTISSFFGYDVTEDSFNPISVIDSCGKQTEVTDYLRGQIEAGVEEQLLSLSSEVEGKLEAHQLRASERKTQKIEALYTDTWMRAIDAFIKTIQRISFKHNYFLFVDGLDVRPSGINAKEYSECIGALVRAVHELNTRILGNMTRKDSHILKIVALTRTDIFLNSDLVNVTSCINDNSVELDWTYSNEKEFKYSKLYSMMNRVLGWDGKTPQLPVDHYFGFDVDASSQTSINAAMYIQRRSRLRPRDIIVLFRLIQKECKYRNLNNPDASVMNSYAFINRYSNYYTEQIKSEMKFQYSTEDIKNIFDLVKTIGYRTFSEGLFQKRFTKYVDDNPHFKELFSDHRAMLDVLYSLDLIGWMEQNYGGRKYHWHYREVKAIDETYRMPWGQMSLANDCLFVIHNGACKDILGMK